MRESWRLISAFRDSAGGRAWTVWIAATGGILSGSQATSQGVRIITIVRQATARIGDFRNYLLRFVGGLGDARAFVGVVEIGALSFALPGRGDGLEECVENRADKRGEKTHLRTPRRRRACASAASKRSPRPERPRRPRAARRSADTSSRPPNRRSSARWR